MPKPSSSEREHANRQWQGSDGKKEEKKNLYLYFTHQINKQTKQQ